MPVDSPEYIESQRDKKPSSPLFWFFLVVVIIGGAAFVGLASR